MSTLKKIAALVLTSWFLLTLNACVSDQVGIGLSQGDGSTQTSDGGEYDGSINGDYSPCEKDADGNCMEGTNNTEQIAITTQSIDYGISEINAIECVEVAIPGGYSYEAEIDNIGDSEQFAFRTSSGTYTQERTSGSGSVAICYQRTELGSHSGQFKILINAGSESGSIYFYAIVLKGQTLEPFFNVTNPTDGQIIDSREGHYEGRDDDEGDFTINARGTVNLDLVSLLKDGINTPLIITSAGVKYRGNISSDGSFSTQIAVPQTPGVYSIEFSVETNEGSEITKTISVVVATKPEVKIVIMNQGGVEVSSGVPSDVQNLILGVKVSNLNVSGSSQTEMPVSVSELKWNGENLNHDLTMWYDATLTWCPEPSDDGETTTIPAADAETYAGFDGTTTFCVPLSEIQEVQSGENTITVKATNEIGEGTAEFNLILDYNKPVINITSPQEKQLFDYNANTQTITISGTVTNYAPLAADQTAPEPKTGDTGSYCHVPNNTETGTTCPESSVMLWINSNVEQNPIYIYPELSEEYKDLSQSELTQQILSQHPERCRNYTTSDSGEITATSDTQCSLPTGNFSLTLTFPNTELESSLNLYMNILEMRAESLQGSLSHRSIAVRTFYTGATNPHTYSNTSIRSGALTTGSLGTINNSTKMVNRAPIMFNIAEGLLKDDANFLPLVQSLFNRYLPAENLVNGWSSWPLDDQDNIDIEADFQRQYFESEGEYYDDFWNLDYTKYQEKFIQQALHSSNMAEKLWAVIRYQGMGYLRGWWPYEESSQHLFLNNSTQGHDQFNVALDSCDQTITTALVPLGDLQYVMQHMRDVDVNDIPKKLKEWPDIAGSNLNFNDFVSGRWIVESVDFTNERGDSGSIDIEACLVPANADVDNCRDPIPDKPDLMPAIWGHTVAYNLIYGGLTGQLDDPILPLIWSVGKLHVSLKDVIRIEKIKENGQITNRLYFDADKIQDSFIKLVTDPTANSTMYDDMEENTVQLYPYSHCEDYYNQLLADHVYDDSGWTKIPFGCDQTHSEQNKPLLLERNSEQGEFIYQTLSANGTAYSTLNMVWQGIMETFGKMIRCADEEFLNPALNSQVFPYPVWVPDQNKLDTNIAVDRNDGELSLTRSKDATNPIFEMALNVPQADININHDDDKTSSSALTFRLPFNMTVTDVPNSNLRLTPLTMAQINNRNSDSPIAIANTSGHLIRTFDNSNLENYPLAAENPNEELFTGISVNFEEIFNSIMYLVFKKGAFSLLDYFDFEQVEVNSNYSIGLDKVVFGRFNICDNIGGVLNTDLPPSLLFTDVASLFNYPATHIDVELTEPPTLAFTPLNYSYQDGIETVNLSDSTHASQIKISLPNVQLSIKELETTDTPNVYLIGREVIKIRIDAVLSLKVIYHEEQMQFDVFIDPYSEQNFHFSIVPGHSGASYDDINVINEISTTVMNNAFGKFAKSFSPVIDEENLPTMSIKFKEDSDNDGYMDIEDLDNVEITFNAADSVNGSCDGQQLPQYQDDFMDNISSVLQSHMPSVLGPNSQDESGEDADESDETDQGENQNTENHFSNLITPTPVEFDPCMTTSPLNQGDPLSDAFCDLGIDYFKIKPTIQIDNKNGYLHLSSDLLFEVLDWVKTEAQGGER